MIDNVNRLSADEFAQTLERCCASTRWLEEMNTRRPFADQKSVTQAAADVWWSLDQRDWREAFQAHPRIGDVGSLRDKFANTRDLATGEQAGVQSASDKTLNKLTDANATYEAKFGYIFIVCAAGKSADEMLVILKDRLKNRPDEEIRIAAAEQLKITQIRLRKLGS